MLFKVEVKTSILLLLRFSTLELNVNRNNPAKDFYAKNGFKIVEEIDIPLDKFWLNDYVMTKNI